MDPRATFDLYDEEALRTQPTPSELVRQHRPSPKMLDAFAAEFETNRSLQAMASRSPGHQTYEQLFDRIVLEHIQCNRFSYQPSPWQGLLLKIGYLVSVLPLEGDYGDEGSEKGMRPLRGDRSSVGQGSRASSRATQGMGGRSASRGSGGGSGGTSRMGRGPSRLGTL